MISATILVCIYILVTLTLTFGFSFIRTERLYNGPETISVIVSATDEETTLPGCIQALEALTYPKDKLEVILVNDRSSDDALQIMQQAVNRNNHFKIVNTDTYEGQLDIKARSVYCGKAQATGDWLFITDANSRVPARWLESMLAGSSPNTGAISGPVNVPSGKWAGIIENQTYAYTFPIGYGFGHMFSSFFCLGKNMAIRRTAYNQTGGLEKIPFRIAEDVALFLSTKKAGFKTLYQTNMKCLVDTLPAHSLGHVETHLKRMIGGYMEHDSWLKFLITNWLGLLFNISLILFFGWLWLPLKAIIVFWLCKILTDLVVFFIYWQKTKARKMLKYFPLFLLLNPLVFFYLPLSYTFSSVIKWKRKD